MAVERKIVVPYHVLAYRVFPTRVGMVLVDSLQVVLRDGFPHTRGGAPEREIDEMAFLLFPPYAWG